VLERDDWSRLDELLDAALERPAGERERFLDEACGQDPEGRARLAELLRLAVDDDTRLKEGGGLRGPVFEELAREIETASLPSPGPGALLGRYVVRGLLGSGGMGSVYRALDPSLGREVAIKALARDFRDDAASLRRFEREARLLATLNHPNIAAIYGLELIEGAPYIVLELVEGETLAERLKRGPLPLPEAVAVGVQVADALQEAHHQGIVHRDLKPSNVKLADSGRVKVLDFGIAKPLPEPSEAEGRPSDPTTTPGTLIGTAPYMSPEQARGQPVDTRSDVWAFGCLLYEMLAGRRAFRGAAAPDVLASVLRDEVEWEALPPDVPAGVRRLLRRCLRKDPRDRLQDAGDARLELTEAAMEEPPAPALRPSRWRRALPPLLGLAAVALVAALQGVFVRDAPLARRVIRLSLDLPAGLTLADDYAAPFALSPDGSRLALLVRRGETNEIYERALEGLAPSPIPGTTGAWQPVYAPDGRSLAFFADRKLKTVHRGGGATETLAEVGGNPRGVSWGEDGTIVLAPSQRSGLLRIDARGGAPEPLTRLDEAAGEASHRWPQVLPGGRHVLLTVALEDASFDEAWLEVASLATGERRRLLAGGAHGRYVPSGHLVFARAGRLLAAPFDLRTLEVRGAPEVVAEGVRYAPENGGTHVAVSADGTLVYTPGVLSSSEHRLAFVDASGRLARITDTPRTFREPSLSPDARRVALVIGGPAESDLWTLDLASRTLSRLTFGLRPRRPTWTPDGRGITVGAPAENGWRLLTFPVDGGGSPMTLLELKDRAYPSAWSPDGRFLVYQERRPETGWDLARLDVGPAGPLGPARPLLATPFQEQNAVLSRDGRFLAYESDELDKVFEVYVRPLREGGVKVRATTTGGRWPRFGPAGQLYYWYSFGGGLRRIGYHAEGDRFVVEAVAPVWSGTEAERALVRRVQVLTNYGNYDVDPAGPRFLMLERSTPVLEPALHRPVIVLNWTAELQARGARRP
jgi:serine/threonine-protein kinase